MFLKYTRPVCRLPPEAGRGTMPHGHRHLLVTHGGRSWEPPPAHGRRKLRGSVGAQLVSPRLTSSMPKPDLDLRKGLLCEVPTALTRSRLRRYGDTQVSDSQAPLRWWNHRPEAGEPVAAGVWGWGAPEGTHQPPSFSDLKASAFFHVNINSVAGESFPHFVFS